LPTSIVTSAAIPSAPSAAALKFVAIEKKMTVRDDADDAGRARFAGRRRREGTAFARCADDRHGGREALLAVISQTAACLYYPSRQRGSAADVHDRQGQRGREVGREDCGDRPADEDRVAIAGDLFRVAVPALQVVVDRQRGQGEGDQGGYAVAWFEVQRGVRAGFVDDAGEHAA
jgi:hypothetical protein